MTNALINSAPLVANIDEPVEREKLVTNVIYPISRALIGNELADELKFPRKTGMPFPLFAYRVNNRIRRLLAWLRNEQAQNFATLLEASAYEEAGMSYRLPKHAHAERSGNW